MGSGCPGGTVLIGKLGEREVNKKREEGRGKKEDKEKGKREEEKEKGVGGDGRGD